MANVNDVFVHLVRLKAWPIVERRGWFRHELKRFECVPVSG